MYVQELIWPHPLRPEAVDQPPQPVLQRIAETQIDPSIADGHEHIAAAFVASRVLRRALAWDDELPGTSFDGIHPLESMAERQVTNCFGYATALSEAIELQSTEHYIAVVNGHAFTVVPSEQDGITDLWYTDAMMPSLNQRIGDSTLSVKPQQFVDRIDQHSRTGFVMFSDQLTFDAGYLLEKFAADKSTWVLNDPKPQQALQKFSTLKGKLWEDHLRRCARMIGTAYPAAIGRSVIANTATFRAAVRSGDTDNAMHYLEPLAGQITDIDTTHEHLDIKRLVIDLARKGETEQARRAAGMYMSSFAISRDPRAHILHGDLLRSVIVDGNSSCPIIADAAMEQYRQAGEKSRNSNNAMVQGKLHKMQAVSQQLTSVDN